MSKFDDVSKTIESSDLFKSMENSNRVQFTALCVDVFKLGEKSKQAEIDELRKRIDERDKLINDFISDLDKTENENNSTSIHDYWRGFGSCAGFAKRIIVERFNDLKGTTNEQ